MSEDACKLCGSTAKLQNSHVIPSFVTREIKGDSVTGFLRDLRQMNKRVQDGGKLPMLCFDCEQRFATAEAPVALQVFQGFHRNDVTTFAYGAWLHYFLASLSWRTLALELADLLTNEEIDEPTKS
jgi:hypothetical protein